MGNNVKKILSVIIVATLVAFYCVLDIPSFMHNKCLLSALTYHFFHTNIVHLVINSCVLLALMFSNRYNLSRFAVAYVIATLAFFVAPVPTVGISNIIYAIVGLVAPPLYDRWWTTANSLCFLLVMMACLFIPNVSAVTHIVSFSAGTFISNSYYAIKQSKSDYGKAKRRY